MSRFNLLCLLVYSLLVQLVMSQYSINIYPQILSQNNRSFFEPDRWNGHNGLDPQKFIAGNLAIGSRPARWNNPDAAYFRQVPEDPNRRGYPDPNFFRNTTLQAKLNLLYLENMEGYGGNNTLALLTWGKFWPSWMNTSLHGEMVPNNLDAGAEMVLLLLEAVNNHTGGLPHYYEINNEPDYFFPKVQWSTVIQYQKIVAQKIHKKFPHLKLIGPSMMTTIQMADNHDFKIWRQARDFLNMSLYNLDAFCFHPYNFLHWENGSHRFTGSNEARLTAFIDLIESYAFHETGKHVPLVTTEFGLSVRSQDHTATTAMMQWAYAFIQNSYMFTYLNHRGVFDKTIAFLYSSPQESFVNKNLFLANGHETFVAKAFRFWKNIDNSNRFLRIDSGFNGKERTISSLALYDKDSNNVTVFLHNYVQSSTIVTVAFNPPWMGPSSADMTCLYLASSGVPTLDTHHVAIIEGKVNLKPESSCFIKFHTTYNFHVAPTYHEQTIYAENVAMPIDGNSVHTSFHVPSIHNVLSVLLRIGVSDNNKAAKTAPTQLQINSATVSTANVFWLYGRDEPHTLTQWHVYCYKLPSHSLKSGTNNIGLHFAQSGGYVSSIALILGTISGN